jgi:hypothetical protein
VLLAVVPGSRDRVHLFADALRLGTVNGIGCCGLGFEPQPALSPPELRSLVERQPDGFGIAMALVPQEGEISLRTLVEPSLDSPRHGRILLRNVLQRSGVCSRSMENATNLWPA